MEQQCSKSIAEKNNNHMLLEGQEAAFHDVVEENPFVDASHALHPDHSLSSSDPDSSTDESTVHVLSENTPDSPSSLSSPGLRRRRPLSQQSCEDISQSQFFKNNPDSLIDFDRQRKRYKRVRSVKDYDILKVQVHSTIAQSFGGDGSQLNNITYPSSPTTVGINERSNEESTTVNSPYSFPILLLTLAELVLKALGSQTRFFSTSLLTFPIWLSRTPYTLASDSLSMVYQWIEKHKFSWTSFIPTIHGLLWFAYCYIILVCFISSPFLLSGTMMKLMVSQPAHMTEELIFDYTRDTPMALVPIISCSNSSSPGHIEKSKIPAKKSQVLYIDREVQATVSLTLPESDYNRNLGIFQVRVDFLSGDGKPLASIRQPSILPFKSEPVRLLWTFFKLAPLLTGYTSETQTLDITFSGYTEKNVRTSCSRVVLEQRAEFARSGGIPEIYAASLKLESRPPYWKRVLWYWKSVIYMGMTSMIFTVELLFMLLCRPIVFPGQRRVGVSSDSDASRNTPPS